MKRTSMHNEFTFEVLDTKTNTIRQKAVAYNVMCNTYFNVLSLSSSWNNGIAYGSGTGTPAVTDTDLFHREGYKNYQSNEWPSVIKRDYINGVLGVRKRIILLPAEAVDKDISEVGISNGTTIYTHAMLQDMNGNPISIHKTDTDQITIYATLYMHWNPAEGIHFQYDGGGNGNTYGLISRFFGFSASNGSPRTTSIGICPVKSARGGYGSDSSYGIPGAYKSYDFTHSGKKISFPKKRFELADANNSGGFRYIVGLAYTEYYYQASFIIDVSKVMPASEIKNESLGTGNGTNKKFGTQFDFPYDMHVFVNGVEVHNYRIIHGPGKNYSAYGGVSSYFDEISPNSTPDNIIPDVKGCGTTAGGGSASIYWSNTSLQVSSSEGEITFRNAANDIGVKSINRNTNGYCKCSNDFEDWVTLNNGNVPVEYQNYKFWKIYDCQCGLNSYDGYNIEFDEAPNDGDVITVNYKTDCINKDSIHIYDLGVDLLFDNYNE